MFSSLKMIGLSGRSNIQIIMMNKYGYNNTIEQLFSVEENKTVKEIKNNITQQDGLKVKTI